MRPGSTGGKTLGKTFFFNFELHTNGDPAFQRELIPVLILNLSDLSESLAEARNKGEALIYRRACHKINTTLIMLGDSELTSAVVELKTDIYNEQLSSFLGKRSEEIIRDLELLNEDEW
jgi:hypothetical protein